MKVIINTEFIDGDSVTKLDTTGILENNKILKFLDGKTKVRLDLENNLLKRENEEVSFEYKFIENEKTLNGVLVNELGLEAYVSIFTESIIKEDNFYSVCYRLVDEENKKIEYCIFWRCLL